MQTNTTTPEAATTTTPATNTNTTPLSAMTGEEVASILVGLIRQNDGVLIQQKVTDGINQSNMNTVIANEYTNGKQAIVTALASVGISATMSDSLQQLAQKMLQATYLINAGGTLTTDRIPITSARILCEGLYRTISDPTVEQVVSSLGSQTSMISISLPKVSNISAGMFYWRSLKYVNIPKFTGDWYSRLNTIREQNNVTRHVIGGGSITYTMEDRMYALYDFKPMGGTNNVTANCNFKGWNALTALSNVSTSLCDKDEWDDANEPTFANNLSKFLWYFEYHFIPCFATVTTSPVLSLNTTVYNAINSANSISDPTKTLKQLLTDKGWEVASVS